MWSPRRTLSNTQYPRMDWKEVKVLAHRTFWGLEKMLGMAPCVPDAPHQVFDVTNNWGWEAGAFVVTVVLFPSFLSFSTNLRGWQWTVSVLGSWAHPPLCSPASPFSSCAPVAWKVGCLVTVPWLQAHPSTLLCVTGAAPGPGLLGWA